MRHIESIPGPLDHYLVGPYAEPIKKQNESPAKKASKYLALHLRFEIDMVAHSLCEFGGGDEEQKELEAFREIHFPALVLLKKTTKYAVLFHLVGSPLPQISCYNGLD